MWGFLAKWRRFGSFFSPLDSFWLTPGRCVRQTLRHSQVYSYICSLIVGLEWFIILGKVVLLSSAILGRTACACSCRSFACPS